MSRARIYQSINSEIQNLRNFINVTKISELHNSIFFKGCGSLASTFNYNLLHWIFWMFFSYKNKPYNQDSSFWV
jgi:hypothetical protein